MWFKVTLLTFYGTRGTLSLDLDTDPNQIIMSFEEGVLTTIFRLEDDRLELVMIDFESPPPLSIEAAAANPELYVLLELVRGEDP